ncbi:phage head morphogenesis protein [Dickeya oryzae]
MGDIINGHYDGSNDSVTEILDALDSYTKIIDGWAHRVAERFAMDVLKHNDAAWRAQSLEIGQGLRNIIDNTPISQVVQSIISEQVKYIKSLPIQAADRVYDIQNRAIEAVVAGERPDKFAQEIAASGDVAESRARMIARTEIGRASTALTQARASSAGSTGYIWRTADDGDVRHSHQKMEGKFVYWSGPPTLDGMTGHAGTLPNCRCWCEVVFPDLDLIESPPSK